MDFERLNADKRELSRRNRALGFLAGALACGQLLSLAVLIAVMGTERTVIVPPTIDKSFWVTSGKASGAYLEQMGSFIAWLVLDVSPATIDWKKDILLGYVEPAQHGALKARQEVEAERLKRINAATAFTPEQLVPSEDGQSVVVRGRLRTLVNGLETANDVKAYLVEFGFGGARMHVRTFKEISNARPKP
ncbi:MAG: type IV conjugative transfer system protein TraE [Azoarcus sp.]|jgi:conjugal transfer pilus assembly protein TraE|nr:type IV conjugative transfer system protein TraE [Azoarcus sp.]